VTGSAGTWADVVLTFALAARVMGVLLFGVALQAKLRNFTEFASIVARYLVLPFGAARVAALLVCGLEAAVVIALLVPRLVLVGAGLSILLLLAFAAAMSMPLLRGERELDCGCMMGALRQPVSWILVGRNLATVALFVPLLVTPGASLDPLLLVSALAAGGILFILNLALGTFVALGASFAELKQRYG
jgi:hypothetical protein